MINDNRTMIVGIGSDFGDDRLGAVAVEQLAKALPSCDVRFLRAPLDLLDVLEGVDRLHVVDACRGAGEPGTILRRNWPVTESTTVRFYGTHDMDLLAALRLAEQLQTLPSRVTIWGIEAADNAGPAKFNMRLSPAVAAAVERITTQIAGEVQAEQVAIAESSSHA